MTSQGNAVVGRSGPQGAGGQSLALAFQRQDGHVVVEVRGEVGGWTGRQLEARLHDLIDGQGNLDVVLDLEPMTFIDSAGLTVIAEALSSLRRRRGTLRLRAPSASALKLLSLAELGTAVTGPLKRSLRGSGARRASQRQSTDATTKTRPGDGAGRPPLLRAPAPAPSSPRTNR